MAIGLIIIGDEILSGRRQDRHLNNLQQLLAVRGLQISWVRILADDMTLLVDTFKQTLASNDIVFCTGGIGATPDDLTREAVAQALGVSVKVHPKGKALLEEFARINSFTITEEHWQLITFPEGSDVFVEPQRKVPGFFVKQHYFMPGFPELAKPMMEWVLDNHYAHLCNKNYAENALLLLDVSEGQLNQTMQTLVARYPSVKLFSLPMHKDGRRMIEMGFKGEQTLIQQAQQDLLNVLSEMGVEWQTINEH